MANKYHNQGANPSANSGGSQAEKRRSRPVISMPEKTANWPGLPGKGSPDRSGGAPKKGPLGPFEVKRI